MSIRVQCMGCGKAQESYNPRHIRDDRERTGRGIMETMLIPARECCFCRPKLLAIATGGNYISDVVSFRM